MTFRHVEGEFYGCDWCGSPLCKQLMERALADLRGDNGVRAQNRSHSRLAKLRDACGCRRASRSFARYEHPTPSRDSVHLYVAAERDRAFR